MNKKLFKVLLPLSFISLIGTGVATTVLLTSCSKTPAPTGNVGNDTGTDWAGYESGSMHIELDASTHTATIDKEETNYTAHNLVFPDKIVKNGVVYDKIVIGQGAFEKNKTGLTGTLTLSQSVISIGGGAFKDCSNLTGDLIIPNSVTSIDAYGFSNCTGFTGLTIPNSVTTIGIEAFNLCTNIFNIDLSEWNEQPTSWEELIFPSVGNNATSPKVAYVGNEWDTEEAKTYLSSRALEVGSDNFSVQHK